MNTGEKACATCFDYWFRNPKKRPPEVSINMSLQVALQVCPECGTYWEASQQFARVISEKEARDIFPRYFVDRNKTVCK
jgi:hypothetical protein